MAVKPILRAATMAGLAWAVAGCTLAETFRLPWMPTPSAWSEPAPAAAEKPSLEWWRNFNMATLDGLMAQAMEGNFDLAAAVARVRQADAQLKIAGASLWPELDAGAGVTRTHSPSLQAGRPKASRSSQLTKFDASLSTSYELDFWGKNQASRDSARASALASRFDQQTVNLTTQAAVATTYFDILGLRERLTVAHENLAIASDILDAVRDRARVGTANDLDLAQQESEVALTRATVPALEQQLRQNVDALAVLVGRLPPEMSIPEGSLAEARIPLVAPGLPSELLMRRPDVRNAEAQLAAANADIGVARAAFFPSISLTGQVGGASTDLSHVFNPANRLFSWAGSLTQPIFRGGALSGDLEKREARYDELVQTYRKAVVSAFSDVEKALTAVRKTDESRQAQQVAVDTARRAYEAAQAQMRGGIIDITSVLNTQKALFQAQDALAQAKLAEIQAVVGLYKALGGGWQAEPLAPLADPPR